MLFPEWLNPALVNVMFHLLGLFVLMFLSYYLSYKILARILFDISIMAGFRKGRYIFRFLTLPGVIVHELSHAAGFILTGYKIEKISFGLKNPDEGAYVKPAGRYMPFTIPFIADMITSFAPPVAGSLILILLLKWLGLMPTVSMNSVEGMLTSFINAIWYIIKNADYFSLKTYVALFLAMSIGAELAPSRVDLRHAVPNTFWSLLILVSLSSVCRFSRALDELMGVLLNFLDAIIISLSVLIFSGVIITVIVIILFGILRLLGK